MNFNPNVNKQAKKVIFSRKIKRNIHPLLAFNNNIVSEAKPQKHLGITLGLLINIGRAPFKLF